MLILFYLLISGCIFAMFICQANILSDLHFWERVAWSYLWPIELFITGDHTYFVNYIQGYVIKVSDFNEKFRNLMYFMLFGIGQETSN